MFTRPMVRKPLGKVGLLLFIALPLLGCNQDKSPLRIGTNIWPGYEPLYLAREYGLLHKQQIHLVEYTSASQVMNAFRNGIIDSAALTLDEVLSLQSEGLDPKIVLVMDISTGGDAILAGPDTQDFKQLKGKRVGVENTALGSYFLNRALQLNGMTEQDINIVPIELHQHIPYFNDNRIDAVVTFEPARTKLTQQGARVLFDSSMIPNEIVDVLVINPDSYKEHRHQLEHLIAAWYQATALVKAEDTKALEIINRRLQLDELSLLKAYEGLVLPNSDLSQKLIYGSKPELLQTAEQLARTMQAGKLVEGPLDPTRLFLEMDNQEQ